jgi:hypothetical protein
VTLQGVRLVRIAQAVQSTSALPRRLGRFESAHRHFFATPVADLSKYGRRSLPRRDGLLDSPQALPRESEVIECSALFVSVAGLSEKSSGKQR